MTRTKLAFHVAAAFVLALTAQRGNAAFFNPAAGPLNERATGSSLMQKTHGCHYSCACGPQRDFGCEQLYHRHLHMLCLPVRCDRGTDCGRTSEGACRHIPPP
jgi:hypothetical protein